MGSVHLWMCFQSKVRAAVVFALGTFMNNSTERNDHANHIDHGVATKLLTVVNDGSPLVRKVTDWFTALYMMDISVTLETCTGLLWEAFSLISYLLASTLLWLSSELLRPAYKRLSCENQKRSQIWWHKVAYLTTVFFVQAVVGESFLSYITVAFQVSTISS